MRMIMKQGAILFAFGLSVFSFSSCTFDKLDLSFEEIGICFETEILPIFVSNCSTSGCHNPVDFEEEYDLTYYNGIMKGIKPFDPKESKLVKYMKKGGDDQMPPLPADPVSADNIRLIEDWINKGAPNTFNCEKSNCDSISNVSYIFDVKPIMETYCNGCHDGPSGGGGYDLTTYNGVKISANNGSLIGSIHHDGGYEPMPLNAGKLSGCRIKTIETWVAEGAPDN